MKISRRNPCSPFFSVSPEGKSKGKGLDTYYSATYMSQTRDQQRFTISAIYK